MSRIDMMAPRPFFEVWTRNAHLYQADAEGLIKDVDGSDIGDLIRVGCIDEIPTHLSESAIPSPIQAQDRLKAKKPTNLLVPKPEE